MIKHQFVIRLNGYIEQLLTDDEKILFDMDKKMITYDEGKTLNNVTMVRYEGKVEILESPYKGIDLFSEEELK